MILRTYAALRCANAVAAAGTRAMAPPQSMVSSVSRSSSAAVK